MAAAAATSGVDAPTESDMLTALRAVVPTLSAEAHKGAHGKVAVLGGCREYTGAPYFAAMSAAKVGADLTYVFCTPSAAGPIKGYSPELIVMPYLPDSESAAQTRAAGEPTDAPIADALGLVSGWLGRMGCIIAGPGLGDDPLVVAASRQVLQAARKLGIPLVVDGSALNFVAKEPSLVRGYRSCILTPNVAELGRLAQGVGVPLDGPISTQWQRHALQVAAAFGGPVLVAKGPVDVISDGRLEVRCTQPGSLKRSGGQGDVLTGATATFVCWALAHAKRGGALPCDPMMLAAYAGSLVTRTASRSAFVQHGRAMMAADILAHLQPALQRWAPDPAP